MTLPVPGMAQEARTGETEDAVLVIGASVVGAETPDLREAALEVGRGGIRVLPSERARVRFEQRHSARAPVISATDIDRWMATSRSAVRNLARADYEAARVDLQAAQELSDRALAELNREVTRSRQVLDTCLYLARAFLETNNAPLAREQAETCRRLVPRGEPTEFNHPPEIMDLLRRVDVEMAAQAPATLRVTSSPPGCAVRLNGLEFGRTPLLSEDLRAGEYRVQVECDEAARGRVHRVRLNEGITVLEVDAVFEAALAIEDQIVLQYADAPTLEQRALSDARRIAEASGATEVWVVRSVPTGARIDRIRTTHRGVIAASSRRTIRESVHAILAAPTRTDPELLFAEPTSPELDTFATPHDGTGEDVLGTIALSLGLGADIASGVFFGLRTYRGRSFAIAMPDDVDYLDRFQTWLDYRPLMMSSAALGGAFVSLSLPFLMPVHDEVPWWSVVLGVVGAGGLATGIVLEGTTARCPSDVFDPDQRCIDAELLANLGGMIAMETGPLVLMPLIHLLRLATRSSTGPVPVVSASARSFSVSLEGAF